MPIPVIMATDSSRRTVLGTIGVVFAGLSATSAFGALPSPPNDPRTIDLRTAGGRISRVTHWRAAAKRGTILFSHGALSSPAKYDRLILPWVAAGYDVWAPLHVDSADHPDTKAYSGFMSWRARIEDMRALSAHVGDGQCIAAGHSYGGLVALTLGGAAADVPEGLRGPLDDPHVKAVIAFSPPGPIKGLISSTGYSALAVPALIQTGDLDSPLGAPPTPDSWNVHLAPFEAAPPGGDRYALVLGGVNHFFGGLICWLDQPGPPQTVQIGIASDISRLFLDAYGRGSGRARRALNARLAETGPVILRRK